jgi:U-box domain
MTECSESYDDDSIAANHNPLPLSQRLPQQHPHELELAPATSDTIRHPTATTARPNATIVMMATSTTAALPTLPTTEIPASFVCPITGRLMEDPVMDSCGHTYERRAILAYMKQCRQLESDCRCPYSQKPLTVRDLIPNHALGERIDKWRWQQEFNCSQFLGAVHDDLSGRSRFVDVELQGQASFDENQQQRRQQAAHVAKTNGDDESDDDAGEDVRNQHNSRRRGPLYWGRRRRARHQREKRYAPVSQQQQPSSCALSLSSSSGSTRSSDDAGTSTFRTTKNSASAAGAPVSEWHPELLHVLPQELHVLSFVQERSQRERQKNLRERRTKCVARGASLLVVVTLLAGAGLGLMLLVDQYRSWSTDPDGSSEGEPSSKERDEWREANTTTATDPPAHLMYERI